MWGSLVLVAILLAADGAVSITPHSGCTTGAIVKRDCNTCICGEDRSWACTRMRCARSKRGMTEKLKATVLKKTQEYADATCSSEEMENPLMKCACVQKGYGSPEDRAQCLEHEPGKEFRVQRVKRSDQVCEPGRTFKRDCNICKCSPQGDNAVCTRKICYKTCRPGVLRFADCNVCLCHQGGWKCTKRLCPPPPKRSSRCQPPKRVVEDESFTLPEDPTINRRPEHSCTPGTTLKDKCNTCWCGPDGKPAACTLMICIPGTYEEAPAARTLDRKKAEHSCTPGTTFKDECNTCWCGPDGKPAACTLMICIPGTYEEAPAAATQKGKKAEYSCTPGTTFKDECNICLCGPDGETAACTLMSC